MNLSPQSIKSIYLVAICGTGMTALAGMLKEQGYEVRGSDQNVYPPMSTFLEKMDIPVFDGYDESHLSPPPDLVVIGNSMSRGNPEVEAVLENKLPYISMPMALSEFFICGHYSCVVSGTHGKTTTSSLLAWMLESAGKDPSFFIGGIPENFGKGSKLGQGEVFVSEGDEYDSAFFDKGSKFLHYRPDLVILNNVEFDHADIFRDLEDVEVAFSRLINLIPRNGYLLSCWDDPVVKKLSSKTFSNLITFGLSEDADWRAVNISPEENGTSFDVLFKKEKFGNFTTPLFGLHMVRNCLGVTAVCHILGLQAEEIRDGLASFKNVRRRLQYHGEAKGIKVFDDFAHHPTEIKTTLEALRSRFPRRRLWAVFEPRTATSKRNIFQSRFVEALAVADNVILTPLYVPEKVPEGERLSVEKICQLLENQNTPSRVLPADEGMMSFLKENLRANDVVLFMSNGDFNQIPAKLIKHI
ncbi:UDP-N-acetylmuramate:L-alanyl-gamma-D-glutamyl-meso-diaminopimelate ligase [candidate division KSB1 bacterium]|nr:UDP-N-acetylmuramate:L-alanyl-gamma-D-glutamyl-meso-diaminopimelate ligase [candidate division KSB1 bacterium]